MSSAEKLANSVWLTLTGRLLMLLVTPVAAIGTTILWRVYDTMMEVQQAQSKSIQELQLEVERHQIVINNEKQSRLEFQARTESQFSELDTKIERLLDGISDVRQSVVRVQTIVETRLPQKGAELGEKKWPQQ